MMIIVISSNIDRIPDIIAFNKVMHLTE